MTATLNTKPGSSSPKQRSTLIIVGKRRGFELADIRNAVGGSLRKLSAAECSRWIKHYSGRDLPNPPGKKPRAYSGKPGGIRMITNDQVDQIERLTNEYFEDNPVAARAWLQKNFKVDCARDLATAGRAGQVINVLKEMHHRRNSA